MDNIKNDFPIFKNLPQLVYLDNGATTQKPSVMLEALTNYYSNKNSNIGRSVYHLAEISENAYEDSRKIVANFINCSKKNIVFTKGCTESLNQVAFIAGQLLQPKQKIVLSIFEHHANILPWQRLAKEKDLDLVFLDKEEDLLYPENLPNEFWDNVGLISLTHVSNVTGQIHPIQKWCQLAKSKSIITCIDGAQGIVSELVNIKDVDCDFYAFSAHKIYGPMGVGILYISNDIITKNVTPQLLGGGIVEEVLCNDYTLVDSVTRFEAGTPNVADIYAFGQTLLYLKENDWQLLLKKNHELNEYLIEQLNSIKNCTLYLPHILPLSHLTSFNLKNIHAHDLGTYLSNKNIAVRVGKHCTHPLHEHLKSNSTVRASIGIYNDKNDIDQLIIALKEAQQFFGE